MVVRTPRRADCSSASAPRACAIRTVAEAVTVGLAAGAAVAGLHPLAFITYVDFLMLALDPLVNYAAKLKFKSAGQLTAPMVVKATAGAKGQGPTHAQSLDSCS